MKRFFQIASGLAIGVVVALLAVILLPIQRSSSLAVSSTSDDPPKTLGKQIAIAADCVACHTVSNEKPFAGGRAIASPFGAIYSTNITPDKINGIGAYSLDDFRAVLYDGIRKDGTLLYPAMPYPSYRKMTESDIRALYAYFMEEVEPVGAASPRTDLTFPFNQRWGLRLWNWVALPSVGFRAYMGDKLLDRGAYLVEALTHCGTCHSPRSSLTFAEKAYDSRSVDFLTGGIVGVWPAPDLRAANSNTQRWSNEQLASLLMGGRNETSGVSGEMAFAVEHSLQYLQKTDIDAIVAYIKAIKQEPVRNDISSASASDAAKQLASASPDLELGARLYLDNCNACHFADGKGTTNVFPSLDGNSLVNSENPGGLISVMLNGARMPSTTLYPAALAMPGFGWRLNNDEAAALASFVRKSWSNNAKAVTKSDVAKIRGIVAKQ